jgi:hypothetical protein
VEEKQQTEEEEEQQQQEEPGTANGGDATETIVMADAMRDILARREIGNEEADRGKVKGTMENEEEEEEAEGEEEEGMIGRGEGGGNGQEEEQKEKEPSQQPSQPQPSATTTPTTSPPPPASSAAAEPDASPSSSSSSLQRNAKKQWEWPKGQMRPFKGIISSEHYPMPISMPMPMSSLIFHIFAHSFSPIFLALSDVLIEFHPSSEWAFNAHRPPPIIQFRPIIYYLNEGEFLHGSVQHDPPGSAKLAMANAGHFLVPRPIPR